MFRIFPLSIIRSFSLYTQQWYMSYRFADSLWAGSGWNSLSFSQAVSRPVWHIPLLCVQWKTPHDGRRNCPKHVEFYCENKFEKLVHLVGFIMRVRCLMTKSFCLHHCVFSHFNSMCISFSSFLRRRCLPFSAPVVMPLNLQVPSLNYIVPIVSILQQCINSSVHALLFNVPARH